MKKFIAAFVLASVSSLASAAVSPFSLPWMNSSPRGDYVSASHTDGIFVLEAYFLGCPYCNENAPNVDELATAYHNQTNVQVLDVGIDRADADYATWISRHHPNHPVLKDANRVVIHQLGTQYYPSTYVVNCRGEVVYSPEAGVWDTNVKAALHSAIDNLIAHPCTPVP